MARAAYREAALLALARLDALIAGRPDPHPVIDPRTGRSRALRPLPGLESCSPVALRAALRRRTSALQATLPVLPAPGAGRDADSTSGPDAGPDAISAESRRRCGVRVDPLHGDSTTGLAVLSVTGRADAVLLVKHALDVLASREHGGHDRVDTLVSWAAAALAGVVPAGAAGATSAPSRPVVSLVVPWTTAEDAARPRARSDAAPATGVATGAATGRASGTDSPDAADRSGSLGAAPVVPAHLEGFGPVPRWLLADVLTRATFRCAVVDHDGAVVAVGSRTWSPTYVPPPTLRRFVTTAHPVCVFPGCSRVAARCDLDHEVPWPVGPTCSHNLSPLCRLHHRLKTHAGWQVRRDAATGDHVWTSPHGRTHVHAADLPELCLHKGDAAGSAAADAGSPHAADPDRRERQDHGDRADRADRADRPADTAADDRVHLTRPDGSGSAPEDPTW